MWSGGDQYAASLELRSACQLPRFAVSDLSRLSGINLYALNGKICQSTVVSEMVLKYLYQDLPDLLDADLQSVSSDDFVSATTNRDDLMRRLPNETREELSDLLKAFGSKQTTSLEALSAVEQIRSILAPAPQTKPTVVPVPELLVPAEVAPPAVPLDLTLEAVPAQPDLTGEERSLLLSELTRELRCNFGRRGEDSALRAFECSRGHPVVDRNTRNLVWSVRSLSELKLMASKMAFAAESSSKSGGVANTGEGPSPSMVPRYAQFSFEFPLAEPPVGSLAEERQVLKLLDHLLTLVETNDANESSQIWGRGRLGPSLESRHSLALALSAQPQPQPPASQEAPPLFYVVGRLDGVCYVPSDEAAAPGGVAKVAVEVKCRVRIGNRREAQPLGGARGERIKLSSVAVVPPPIQDILQTSAYTLMANAQWGELVQAEVVGDEATITTFKVPSCGKANDGQPHTQLLLDVVLPRLAHVVELLKQLRRPDRQLLRTAFVWKYTERDRGQFMRKHLDFIEAVDDKGEHEGEVEGEGIQDFLAMAQEVGAASAAGPGRFIEQGQRKRDRWQSWQEYSQGDEQQKKPRETEGLGGLAPRVRVVVDLTQTDSSQSEADASQQDKGAGAR